MPQTPPLPADAPRLLCAARYGPLGASSRLRLMQYLPYLARAGFQVDLRAFLSDAYITALYAGRSRVLASARAYLGAIARFRAARHYDLLWIEKEYLPWMPYWVERLAIGKTPYILDFDDAWALRYVSSRSRLVRRLLGDKFTRLIRGAAMTITANENLHQWARDAGAKHLQLLPTVVDLAHYPAAAMADGVFTIGWIGTPVTLAYLDEIADILRELAAEAPLMLLIIGAPGVVIPGVTCEAVAWTAASEAAQIARCHVGIMPLPDDEWAAGKSGYKLIQYMAMARPTLASAIGANNQIVADGETGFLVSTRQEWLDGLRRLRGDPALAAALGAAGRRRVEQHYCLDITAPILIARIRDSLGNTG